jgi:PAS domain S-box-containing protein
MGERGAAAGRTSPPGLSAADMPTALDEAADSLSSNDPGDFASTGAPRQAGGGQRSGHDADMGSRRQMRRMVTRSFFAVAAAALALSALLTLMLPQPGATRALQFESAALFAVLALGAALCMRIPKRWLLRAMVSTLVLTVLVHAWIAVRLGWGLQAPGLAAFGLLVCVQCASAGMRAGTVLAVVSALALAAVQLFSPTGDPAQHVADLLRLGTHWALVAAGLAAGAMTHTVVQRYMRAAADREDRFRSLLALAADAYWEVDVHYRLLTAGPRSAENNVLTLDNGLGQAPWDLPQFDCDHDTLDTLQADMDARVPFRDLPLRWLPSDGSVRRFLVSGEPRFDERGVFTGYWGVARDVTDAQAVRDALAATESRYQELFARSPAPLVVHRNGRVLDANPSALQLLGHDELPTLLGRDLLASFESGDSRERARRRIEALQALPPGTALPVADFRLHVLGRVLAVRATGVRVTADGGPATLSIFIDVSERRAAEEAVRRSEAMLSHLVATSPDLITLTDLATGRYAMVNQAFERTIGYGASEAIGRTAAELGVWANLQDREQFVDRLREQGAVSNLPMRFRSKAGVAVPMLVSAARFVMDQRDYVVINARDVTESERARQEREAILTNASIGIAVTRDRLFVLANPAFELMFGWPPGLLVGQAGSVVWPGAADYAALGAAAGPVLTRGELFETERLAQRRDGSTFLARVSGRAIDPKNPADGGTVWIIEDVTQRREFEQALARARDDAEAASRAKSAFLANTSHELRTPLNGMIGLAELARAPDIDDVRRRDYLNQIAESAQSLAGIISDILDLSKIEAGKLQVESTAFELGELLASLQRGYGTLAAPRDIGLHFDVAPDVQGTVAGDPLRVRQIISNFLSNALKFTAEGSVRLTARRLPPSTGGAAHAEPADGRPGERAAGLVRIEVQDTGPGIATDVQARLFRPFTQADESTTRRFGGTGLGLSICRELATLMGGTVGVDSQPGAGSCFWAELPLPPTDPLVAAPAPDGASLQGMQVLLVEDNEVNMTIAAAVLQRWGVQVDQAVNGEQALQAVQRAASVGRRYDAVLMDVHMPVMSGHEATRALRRTEAGRHLPIIALTAAALVTERDEALEAGMNDFLTKPIDIEKMRLSLLRWTRRH